jgi:S-adenosyl-L-methionine hydrolase (adenosine-forming)
MKAPSLITLSSDFEKQSYGCGAMEGAIFEINPKARVIHHMHGIEGFNLFQAARTMETITKMPVGCHVCVVDPGVGTKRRGIVIQTRRGDFLVGPDNGILLSSAKLLGGIKVIHELKNSKLQKQPVSPIFHGRDIFATAAGHLSKGVKIDKFGPAISEKDLIPSPYEDAAIQGDQIEAKVIHMNRFGTIFLNILQKTWDDFAVPHKSKIILKGETEPSIMATHVNTFGEVSIGEVCIMKDDYTRVEVAINQGSLFEKFPAKIGENITLLRS